MRELDRLIRRAGGVLVRIGRHREYLLDGETIRIHLGTKVHSRQVIDVKSRVRRALRRRRREREP
jgi:hypothetical protein